MRKREVKEFTLRELEKTVVELGELPYRAKQIFRWLYRSGATGFDEMKDVPKALRDKLDKNYYISTLLVSKRLESADGTERILFKLQDGHHVEAVIIPAKKRKTLCLSTQVGCRFACPFCASGRRGYIRNLTASEIINQALFSQHNLKHNITNYVFMGMGEPLDNYENVKKAIILMNDSRGMDVGARRITISTCGIISGIDKLKDLWLKVNLSVSLHAGNNELRNKLMPVNKRYPLERLIKACEDFRDKTGRIITLEYVLMKGTNDSARDAAELAALAKRLRAKVNLIPYSAIPGLSFRTPQPKDIKAFVKRLIQNGINVTLRESKGEDIQAACGQLSGKDKNET